MRFPKVFLFVTFVPFLLACSGTKPVLHTSTVSPDTVFYFRANVLIDLDKNEFGESSSLTKDWQQPLCTVMNRTSSNSIPSPYMEPGAVAKIFACRKAPSSFGERSERFASLEECRDRARLAGSCNERPASDGKTTFYAWTETLGGIQCDGEIVAGRFQGTKIFYYCMKPFYKDPNLNHAPDLGLMQNAFGMSGTVQSELPRDPAPKLADASVEKSGAFLLRFKKKTTIDSTSHFFSRSAVNRLPHLAPMAALNDSCFFIPPQRGRSVSVAAGTSWLVSNCSEIVEYSLRSEMPSESECQQRAHVCGECGNARGPNGTRSYLWVKKQLTLNCELHRKGNKATDPTPELLMTCLTPLFKNVAASTVPRFELAKLQNILGHDLVVLRP